MASKGSGAPEATGALGQATPAGTAHGASEGGRQDLGNWNQASEMSTPGLCNVASWA